MESRGKLGTFFFISLVIDLREIRDLLKRKKEELIRWAVKTVCHIDQTFASLFGKSILKAS